jgi:plastocyanin
MRKLLVAMMAVGVGVALLVSGGAQARPGTKQVLIHDNWMAPHGVRIHKGSRVKWVWHNTENDHNVTCRITRNGCRGHLHSSTRNEGTFTVTFNRVGDFKFVCTIHRGSMYTNVHVR